MALPSIHYLHTQAKKSFIRFPWVIICGMVAAFLTVFLIASKFSNTQMMPLLSTILSSALGIPLFFSMAVTSQKKAWSKKKTNLANLLILILLIVLYVSFPNQETARTTSQPNIRYVHIATPGARARCPGLERLSRRRGCETARS
ncbi:MAG: hypothetical protein ACKPB0_13010 [Opitutaceae bacterium]